MKISKQSDSIHECLVEEVTLDNKIMNAIWAFIIACGFAIIPKAVKEAAEETVRSEERFIPRKEEDEVDKVLKKFKLDLAW